MLAGANLAIGRPQVLALKLATLGSLVICGCAATADYHDHEDAPIQGNTPQHV
jgi:hypothetical protein